MEIREATSDDLDAILELFSNTILFVNSQDYTKEQVEIWMNARDRNIWLEKIASQSFFVALTDDVLVGFGSIDPEGYLDFMYVHHEYQRQGIAKALLDVIENQARDANLKRIWSSVSITAQPFFTKHGYKHYEDEHKMVSGVHFKNALMEKRLS